MDDGPPAPGPPALASPPRVSAAITTITTTAVPVSSMRARGDNPLIFSCHVLLICSPQRSFGVPSWYCENATPQQRLNLRQGKASRITSLHERSFGFAQRDLRLHQVENRRRSLAIPRSLHSVVLGGYGDTNQRQLDTGARGQIAVVRLRDELTCRALEIRAHGAGDTSIRARPGHRELALSAVPYRQRDVDCDLRTLRCRRKQLGVVGAGHRRHGDLGKVPFTLSAYDRARAALGGPRCFHSGPARTDLSDQLFLRHRQRWRDQRIDRRGVSRTAQADTPA